MSQPSPLDDPHTSAHAWARYKRLMKLMACVTGVVIVTALGLIYSQTGMVSVHLFIATALGIGFSMLLMATLMGLVFLSSGTGHDEAVTGNPADQATGGEGRKR